MKSKNIGINVSNNWANISSGSLSTPIAMQLRTNTVKNGDKGMDEFLGIAPCLNAAMKEIDKCYSKVITKLHGVRDSPVDLKIPHICWLVIYYLILIKI